MAPCCGIKSRIATLFDDASTSDVTFVIGEDKVRFPAHALVMSTASESFKAMFFGDFNCERVVEIPEASPDGFRSLLKFIYTEEADITVENVESVMVLSDKYLLTDLFAASTEWIKRIVTASNVLRFLPLTELYGDLAECCWKIVFDHGDDVLNSRDFLSLPKNLLAKMLASDELVADEKMIYTHAVDWAKCQLEHDRQQLTPSALRAVLGDLLYLIRFPLFEAKEFDSWPAKEGILNEKSVPSLFNVRRRRSAFVGLELFMKEFGLRGPKGCEHEKEAS